VKGTLAVEEQRTRVSNQSETKSGNQGDKEGREKDYGVRWRGCGWIEGRGQEQWG